MLSDQQNAQLNAYLDDELDLTERESVERWLTNDPEAAQVLETLKQTQTILRGSHSPEPNIEEAWQEFSKELRQSTSPKPSIRFPIPLSAAAAMLILGVVFWVAWPSNQPMSVAQKVEMVTSDLEASSPIVYIDAESGWTIVWVEPASQELTPAS